MLLHPTLQQQSVGVFNAASPLVWITVCLQASPVFAGANMEETHFEIGKLANILLV